MSRKAKFHVFFQLVGTELAAYSTPSSVHGLPGKSSLLVLNACGYSHAPSSFAVFILRIALTEDPSRLFLRS